MTAASSGCGCGAPQDPRVVTNLPGLNAIADRVDDFTGFRRALLRPLPGEQALGSWRPAEGDLGLQVLEWWAYLADVLTFYNERIANEGYLRTATSAQRLANLVALIGYAPRPGIAATGQLALLRTAAHPNEPLIVPAGLPVSSTATPEVPSQVFEVDGSWQFPGPSSVPVVLAPDDDLALNAAGGPASVLLAGKVNAVKPGDQVLLVAQGWNGSTDDDWAWVQVASVAPGVDPGTGASNTLVTFTANAVFGSPPVDVSPLHEIVAIDVFSDRIERDIGRLSARSAAAAPPGSTVSSDALDAEPLAHASEVDVADRLRGIYWRTGQTVATREPAQAGPPQAPSFQLLRPTQTTGLWNQSTHPGAVIDTSTTPIAVHLGAAVRAITPGELVVFDGGATGVALATVAGVSELLWAVPYPTTSRGGSQPLHGHGDLGAVMDAAVSPPPPDIVIAHSVLALTTPDQSVLEDFSNPTLVTLRYGLRPVGTVIGTPTVSLASLPQTVQVPAAWSVPDGSPTAILQDTTGAGVLVQVTDAGTGQAALDPLPGAAALSRPLLEPLQLLLDLVPVTRGRTVSSETLGSGNATAANQSFTLRRSPLTYLSAGTGVTSSLTVYVDGVSWFEVSSLYGQSPGAQVYEVSLAGDGRATVTFGDGINGARLPSGSGNIVAGYRFGSGFATPPAGRLTTVGSPQPNLAAIANPIAATFGADPEPPSDVRTGAPASVATFGAAISAVDYETIAAHAAGVSRVSAVWSVNASTRQTAVTVYVGDGDDAVSAAQAALAGSAAPNRPVTVLGATEIDVTISATLQVAADQMPAPVLATAVAALTDLFSPMSMGIGAPLFRSQVDAALSVSGVLTVSGLSIATANGPIDQVLAPDEGAYFALAGVAGIGTMTA